MDSTQILVAVITVFGVFISSGVIQFFVNRKDKKREDARKDEYEALRKEFSDGIKERERIGNQRYEEHEISIEKMNLQHQKDFQALQEAIHKLTDNDTKITESIENIAETQSIMADSLVGMAHDRIMHLTDRITARGSITNKEKATIKSMYDPYRGLGGNGEVREAVEYVLTLPTVTDEEGRNLDFKLRGKEYQEMRKAYESNI